MSASSSLIKELKSTLKKLLVGGDSSNNNSASNEEPPPPPPREGENLSKVDQIITYIQTGVGDSQLHVSGKIAYDVIGSVWLNNEEPEALKNGEVSVKILILCFDIVSFTEDNLPDVLKIAELLLNNLTVDSLNYVMDLSKITLPIPKQVLSLIYSTINRLLQESQPPVEEGERSAIDNKGRELPTSWFSIAEQASIRLYGRARLWGGLRGYTFGAWFKLNRKSSSPTSSSLGGLEQERQIFRFASSVGGAACESYFVEEKDGVVSFAMRSKATSTGSWSVIKSAPCAHVNRWHYITVSHSRPYLLGKAKVHVTIDAQVLSSLAGQSVPFPSFKETDDVLLGNNLNGRLANPVLYEGGDVASPAEVHTVYSTSRVTIEPLHLCGVRDDDQAVDDEDDEATRGLGYGQEDAADHQVEAGEVVMEIANRALGMQGTDLEEKESEYRRMIFTLDAASADRGVAPELVLRGIRKGKLDAVELQECEASAEDEAVFQGGVTAKHTPRKAILDLVGGAEAFLLLLKQSPVGFFSDALMTLCNALRMDSYFREQFISLEGFALVGAELRKRGGVEKLDEILQLVFLLMKAGKEKECFVSPLQDILLDPRSPLCVNVKTYRLLSPIINDKKALFKEHLGIDRVLRLMEEVGKGDADALKVEITKNVIFPMWSEEPTYQDVSLTLCYVVENPSCVACPLLIGQLKEMLENGLCVTAFSQLGGASYLLKLGTYSEVNLKNPVTGAILRDPEPLPSLLFPGTRDPPVPLEVRASLIRLIGSCVKRGLLIGPPNSVTSEGKEVDVNTCLSWLLAILKNAEDDVVETNEVIVRACLDGLPMPHGLAVWSALAINDVKGMAKVADALRRTPKLCKVLLSLRGWFLFFAQYCEESHPVVLSAAAKSAIVSTLQQCEDPRVVEELVRGVVSEFVYAEIVTMVLNVYQTMHPVVLGRLLLLSRARLLNFGDDARERSFIVKSLEVGEYLRDGNKYEGCWLPLWIVIKDLVPTVTDSELLATCVRLALSIVLKELNRPSVDNRRRVFSMLECASREPFTSDGGLLRSELCMGVLQGYSLDDNQTVSRALSAAMEDAESVPDAVRTVLNSMAPQLDDAKTKLAKEPVRADDAEEPAVWQLSASSSASLSNQRLKQFLRSRVIESVRNKISLKVTERVREKRFESKWSGLVADETARRVAVTGLVSSYCVDAEFCERGSRCRRKLVPMTALEIKKDAAAPVEGEVDVLKIGQSLSRQIKIADPSQTRKVSESNNKEEEEEVEKKPDEPNKDASSKFNMVEAKARRMTLEEWVNRPPLAIRGELDGRWIDVEAGEKILLAARAHLITARGESPGRLVVSTLALYFDPDPVGAAGQYYVREEEEKEKLEEADDGEVGKRQRWSIRGIQRILLRRYRMLDSGCEVFMRGDASLSVFLRFESVERPKKKVSLIRDRVVKTIISLLPKASRDRSQKPKSSIADLVHPATQAWRVGALSNFDYLMELNILAGRSVHDLNVYPVFPWVLSDYESEEIDLEDARVYRDLSKPMGALDPARLEQYQERYETFDDPNIPKFMYGSHYSTAAGVVLHFLVRVEPFRSLHLRIHDNKYDAADRMFVSVQAAFEGSAHSQDLGEVKEVVPEFYYLPSVFVNKGRFDMGTSQNGVKINDVVLPRWAKGSADVFVSKMRAALEGNIVSASLHQWINLIFGVKQRGPAAVKANNVFYYLTYPGIVDLEAISDAYTRKALEMQIAHFGQCPEQLEEREGWSSRDFCPAMPGFFSLKRRVAGVEFPDGKSQIFVQARIIKRAPLPLAWDESESEIDDGNGGGLVGLNAQGQLLLLVREVEDKDKEPAAKRVAGKIHSPSLACWSSDASLLVSVSGYAVGADAHRRLTQTRGSSSVLEVKALSPSAEVVAAASVCAHEAAITSIAMDDGLLVSGASDGSIRLWRVGKLGALRRPAVWRSPRRFLRGHPIGFGVCAVAVHRAMGVVSSASAFGVIAHDVLSGRMLWVQRDLTSVERMVWDRKTGSLFCVLREGSFACVSLDGTVLKKRDEGVRSRVRCSELVMPGVVVVATEESVEVLELPFCQVFQVWPVQGTMCIAPNPRFSEVEDHVVVNLVMENKTVFVLRRMSNSPVRAGSYVAGKYNPAVTASVNNNVSTGQKLIGALDKVKNISDAGKGIAGEVWSLFGGGKQ